MVNRFLEVVAMVILVVLTIGTTFQVLNYQLLREVQQEIKVERAAARAEPRGPIVLEVPAMDRHVATVTPPPVVKPPAEPVVESPPAPAVAKPAEEKPPMPVAANVEPAPAPKPKEEEPVVPPTGADLTQSTQWGEYGPTVRQTLDELFTGKYDKVIERLTPEVAQTITPELLRRSVEQAKAKSGEPRSVEEVSVIRVTPLDEVLTFRVALPTASDKKLVVSISLTPQKKVSGLFFPRGE